MYLFLFLSRYNKYNHKNHKTKKIKATKTITSKLSTKNKKNARKKPEYQSKYPISITTNNPPPPEKNKTNLPSPNEKKRYTEINLNKNPKIAFKEIKMALINLPPMP